MTNPDGPASSSTTTGSCAPAGGPAHPGGPVLVGMDLASAGSARSAAALDIAAREALRRRVDLRLVYGLATLPAWPLAGQLIDAVLTGLACDHPALAVTTALYPGTTPDALAAAAGTGCLVVLSDPRQYSEGYGAGAVEVIVAGAAQAVPLAGTR